MIFIFSLTNNYPAHASWDEETDVATIYLQSLTRLLYNPRRFFPFFIIEDMIEELTIHELIHKFTGIRMGSDHKKIDGWHGLLCRIEYNKKKCDCPNDCIWRF